MTRTDKRTPPGTRTGNVHYRHTVGLLLPLLFALLAAGCSSLAHFPVNPPIDRVTDDQPGQIRPHDDREILLTLTFSGGGSRASALAYGVLEELHSTPNPLTGERLLDEVDLISSVSGGSVTAAYYGLYGDRLFSEFRAAYLERDMGAELKNKLFSASTMSRLQSETYGSGDVLDEFFRDQLFGDAPLGELFDRNGPLVEINATDLFKGGRFDFSAQTFNLICSDAGRFPVSRAVAASSAVPLIFSPVTLANRAGSCNYQPPAWLHQGLAEKGVNNRRHQIARRLQTYLEQAEHPYIHLLDGGLSDNLGIRAVLERIIIQDGLWNTLRHFHQENAGHMVLIVVDASATPPSRWELSAAGPPETAVLDAATTTPLANYSFEMLEYLRGNLPRWHDEMREARCGKTAPCGIPQVHLIELRLQDVPDPQRRKRLTEIPTGLTLEPGMADELIRSGRELLRGHPEYRRLLDGLERDAAASPDRS